MDDKPKFPIVLVMVGMIMFVPSMFYLLSRNIPEQKHKLSKYDTEEYFLGFRDGIDCVILTNLEFSLKKESKTFGELRDICIERNKIKEK